MAKPNLLFIFTDEQRRDTMNAYGNAKIQTPVLDKLAGESVLFENCYCTQPVCTPARSSIMTGLYPHTTGCTTNNIPLRPETPCLPELVDEPCATGYFGKWHLGDEIYPQHGFKDWVAIEEYSKYWSEGRDQTDRSHYFEWLFEKGYLPEKMTEEYRGYYGRGLCTTLREQDTKPSFLAEKVSSWLSERESDERFVAYVNFLEPHMPFFGPRDGQYDPDEIDLPPNYHHVPGDDCHPRTRMLWERYQRGFERSRLDCEAGWRRIIASYWGLCSQVDTAVGRILAALEATGQADNTIIVYTSDHGDMMGSHQLVAKMLMYEESAGVPLLVKAPGVDARRVADPVSQIDLVPTLLDLMEESAPDHMHGNTLRPTLERGATPDERDVFIEWSGLAGAKKNEIENAELARAYNDPIRTVVTPDGWKLNHSPDIGHHELFNLKSDPYEMENLYGKAEHAALVEDLRGRIRGWGERVGDEVAVGI
jgi:arylsulfatase A-like enzyme